MERGRSQDDELGYPPGFAQALGRQIKVSRTDLGIERRQLAERAGISYSYMTEIENGNKPPSASVLERIARALGMRMSELIHTAENRVDMAELRQGQLPPREVPVRHSPLSLRAEEASTLAQQDLLMRAAPGGDYAMRPSFRGPKRNLRTALMELEEILPYLSPEDIERVLDFARRLAAG